MIRRRGKKRDVLRSVRWIVAFALLLFASCTTSGLADTAPEDPVQVTLPSPSDSAELAQLPNNAEMEETLANLPSAFQYSQSLTEAKVQPPAPFTGAGFYDANRDRRHRWFGPLSVDLPGRRDVSLTNSPLQGFIDPARWVPPRPKKGS
jgi:hypothetical protein